VLNAADPLPWLHLLTDFIDLHFRGWNKPASRFFTLVDHYEYT
jgi:hypothetical protein